MAWTTRRVVEWLTAYDIWRGELEAQGLYRPPTEGTVIRSTRAGRPTERAAIHLMELPRRCRIVERWLQSLRWYEITAAEHYRSRATVADVATALQIEPVEAEAIILHIPRHIMHEFYSPRAVKRGLDKIRPKV